MDPVLRGSDLPYCGDVPLPAEIWQSWNTDPALILALVILLFVGLFTTARRGVFFAGWLALVVAFVSPLCALTSALFTARALHHLLLFTLAAPLLTLAVPIPARLRPQNLALLGFAGSAFALALWHLPLVYSAIWQSHALYWLMQAALLLPAWALWSAVFASWKRGGDRILGEAFYLAGLGGVMGLIAALLTFAPSPLYAEHFLGSLAWGLDPLLDQQLAGLIMWVPGMMPLALIAALMLRSFAQEEPSP